MKQTAPLRRVNKRSARSAIFSTDMPQPVLESAWMLFLHELERTNPKTEKPFTEQEALENVFCWMAHQKRIGKMVRLTSLERIILHLMVYDGLSMKQIAVKLNKSYPQIKQKALAIREKMGAETMVQAAVRAAQMGWKSTSILEE